MWRTAVDQRRTAALYLGLVLSHVVGGVTPAGGAVKVPCRLGQRVTFPCWYSYEDEAQVSQLSVQWRSPRSELLCHYIKHRTFQNCSAGFSISYSPGSIALTVQRVRPEDLGTHVCSVSKRHKFSDYRVELVKMEEAVSTAPASGAPQSGLTWRLAAVHALISLFVCL